MSTNKYALPPGCGRQRSSELLRVDAASITADAYCPGSHSSSSRTWLSCIPYPVNLCPAKATTVAPDCA